MFGQKPFALVMLVALLLLLPACAPTNSSPSNGNLRVVTTIGMLADVVRAVGGEQVTVVQLMGPGVDPHLYSATERDVEALSQAQVIFYNGLNLEARLAGVLDQLGATPGVTVVAVGEQLPTELVLLVLLEDSDTPVTDPHIWMDVARWIIVTEVVRDTLIAADPAGADSYRANAEIYLAELTQLDEWVRQSIASIPEDQRRLVTAHDAFQYFSAAYGIEVFAPQGISTEAEASVADIQQTIAYVVTHQVPAVFFESSIPVDTIEAIIEGAGAQGHTLAIGGELFADAMGAEGTPEGTYIGMIRHNTLTIVTALGGNPAPSP